VSVRRDTELIWPEFVNVQFFFPPLPPSISSPPSSLPLHPPSFLLLPSSFLLLPISSFLLPPSPLCLPLLHSPLSAIDLCQAPDNGGCSHYCEYTGPAERTCTCPTFAELAPGSDTTCACIFGYAWDMAGTSCLRMYFLISELPNFCQKNLTPFYRFDGQETVKFMGFGEIFEIF
jgi:hypothetical protein